MTKFFKNNLWLYFACFTSLVLQGQIQWARAYGTPNDNLITNLRHALLLPDGGFLLTGQQRNSAVFNNQPLIVKTDKDGNQIWQRTYAELGNGSAVKAVSAAANGNTMVLSQINENGKNQIVMAFLDANGTITATKRYGNPQLDNRVDNIITTRNGQLLIKASEGVNAIGAAFFRHQKLYRLTETGDIIWQKTYPVRNCNCSGRDIVETNDGGFFMSTDSIFNTSIDTITGFSTQSSSTLDLKVDANGNVVSVQKANPSSPGVGLPADNATLFADGTISRSAYGLIVSGISQTVGSSWVKYLATQNNIIPNQSTFIGGGFATTLKNDYAQSIVSIVNNTNNNSYQFSLSSFDKQGNLRWTKFVPMSNANNFDYVRYVLPNTTDTCFYAVGERSFNFNPSNLFNNTVGWFAKFCSGATRTSEKDNLSEILAIDNNPMSSQAVVHLKNAPLSTKGNFQLVNLQGQILRNQSFSGDQFVIERLNLTQGFYFVRVETQDGKVGTIKLTIMD